MKKKILLFDLDDTLINSKLRQYEVVKSFAKSNRIKAFYSYEEYLEKRKSNNFSNKQLLSLESGCIINIVEFENYWNQNIESASFLEYDKPYLEKKILQEYKNINDSEWGIISLRTNIKNADSQLVKFGFDKLFDLHFFLPHNNNINPKIRQIEDLKEVYEIIGLVGDSKIDKEAANVNGINFFAVETGLYKLDCDVFTLEEILKTI
ncbi:HAD hydrolase-like protein [Chitinophagaceae bacterium LWZ2-11]